MAPNHPTASFATMLGAVAAALGGTSNRIVRAPGRVNLIGDHTDYAEGFVLPMAIDRECLVGLRRTNDSRIRARSFDIPGEVDLAADGTDDPATVEPRWGGFVAGVVQAVLARGATLPGLELAISSTVPAGSGLSSSSALSVALTLTLADTAGLELGPDDIARAALDAEIRATGVPGGLMDQLTSVHGVAEHALLIDCRTLAVEPIAIPGELTVLVVHSGVARTLAGSAYAERRASTERAAARLGIATLRDATLAEVHDDPFARHVVTENARVLAFAEALRVRDVGALGPLLLASHASLRDDFAVSTPELDLLVDAFVAAGALGARLTGAGFGGCVVGLALTADAPGILDRTVERYRSASGREPSAFVVRAVAGAGMIEP
jgi:galactokinase